MSYFRKSCLTDCGIILNFVTLKIGIPILNRTSWCLCGSVYTFCTRFMVNETSANLGLRYRCHIISDLLL